MKITMRQLRKIIKEAIDDVSEPEFKNLMDIAAASGTGAIQAWEMQELLDLSDKQKQALYDLAFDTILNKSLEPGPQIKRIGYDFHNLFKQVYGFSPPVGDFKLSSYDDFELVTMINGLEFRFGTLWDGSIMPIEPIIQFESSKYPEDDVWISVREDGRFSVNLGEGEWPDGDSFKLAGKDQLPNLIRDALDIPVGKSIPGWPELSG